ncbi:hypothetical protein [Okeania sp. SIO2C2]|uniref:hypothetical protein n=1 Tax=Okeania sp. SIO2C2 TaxID=2607787 RepID=UPI00257BD7AC|nr:hypothetical protein [Okeania sp. SIO2C2]
MNKAKNLSLLGNREQGINISRKETTGNRQQATGNRQPTPRPSPSQEGNNL